jgi:hypothetical protein
MNWSKKGALYGGVGGALTGGLLGYLTSAGDKNVGVQTVAGVLLVGAIGAAGGALVPPLLAPAPAATPSGTGKLPTHPWIIARRIEPAAH